MSKREGKSREGASTWETGAVVALNHWLGGSRRGGSIISIWWSGGRSGGGEDGVLAFAMSRGKILGHDLGRIGGGGDITRGVMLFQRFSTWAHLLAEDIRTVGPADLTPHEYLPRLRVWDHCHVRTGGLNTSSHAKQRVTCSMLRAGLALLIRPQWQHRELQHHDRLNEVRRDPQSASQSVLDSS